MFVIIVGGGKVGVYLANLLVAGGARVRLVESRRDKLQGLQRQLSPEEVVFGSGADPHVLADAGVREADVVAVMTGADETNLVVAGLARSEFHVPRVIARVNDPNNAWMFRSEMGVDVFVNQAEIMSHLIAEEMSVGEMMTLLKLRKGEYALVEEKVHPRSKVAGKAIMEIPFPAESIITAVIRNGKLLVPRGALVLLPEDEVLAVVHSAELSRLSKLIGPK